VRARLCVRTVAKRCSCVAATEKGRRPGPNRQRPAPLSGKRNRRKPYRSASAPHSTSFIIDLPRASSMTPDRPDIVLRRDRSIDLDHERLAVVGPELVFDALHALFRWLHFLTPTLSSSAVNRRSRSAVAALAFSNVGLKLASPGPRRPVAEPARRRHDFPNRC
jgi:hypothetical protein